LKSVSLQLAKKNDFKPCGSPTSVGTSDHAESCEPRVALLNMNMPQKSESTDCGVQHFGEYITYSRQPDGIFTPSVAVVHRDDEYDSRGFGLLRDIQSRHFWYQGRHRFLLEALKLHLPKLLPIGNALTPINLGGGCGGRITFMQERPPDAQYSNEPRFRSGNPARAMVSIPVGHLYPWCLSKAVLTDACSRNPI
jgi:hypothetical protein